MICQMLLRPRTVKSNSTRCLRWPDLPAAIDAQHLAGNERAHRAGEQLDHARQLVDGGDAVERLALGQPRRIDGAGALSRSR